MAFGAITLLINNSVTFDKLGAVNGLAVSLTAFFRLNTCTCLAILYGISEEVRQRHVQESTSHMTNKHIEQFFLEEGFCAFVCYLAF